MLSVASRLSVKCSSSTFEGVGGAGSACSYSDFLIVGSTVHWKSILLIRIFNSRIINERTFGT